jgi:hypothetical protein
MKIIFDIILENRKIFGYKAPNLNASPTYFHMLLKRSRIVNGLLYLIYALVNSIYRKPKSVQYSELSILSSNSVTQLNTLRKISLCRDFLVPISYKSKKDEINEINIKNIVTLSLVYHSIKDFLKVNSDLSNIDFVERVFLFVSCIEANVIKLFNPKILNISYQIYGIGASASLLRGVYTRSGFHGLPVGDYGWTPVWNDEYFVFGQSTKRYLLNKNVDNRKITFFPKIKICQESQYKKFRRECIGLIEGGAPGNLNRLVSFARELGFSLDQIFLFVHPSSKSIYSKDFPGYKVMSFDQFKNDNFRMLFFTENSTGFIRAIERFCPVIFTPTSLPRLNETFITERYLLEKFKSKQQIQDVIRENTCSDLSANYQNIYEYFYG